MAAVAVVGDALIDEVRDDDGVREHVGGAGLNVAVGLARLGHDATLIAMVGDDESGERIRALLAQEGVALIATPAPLGTARAISTRVDGEPAYEFDAAARNRRIRFGPDARAAIATAGVVAISCVALDDEEQAAELADAVAGVRVALDANPRAGMMRDRAAFSRGFDLIAAGAELVKVGSDDAELLGASDVDALADRVETLGARGVLVTRGADGATLRAGSVRVDRGIVELPGAVVDTMGAGDAAFAAAVAHLASGRGWEAAGDAGRLLEEAMAVAAATCRAEGALLRRPGDSGGSA